jgi:hypothetical protein
MRHESHRSHSTALVSIVCAVTGIVAKLLWLEKAGDSLSREAHRVGTGEVLPPTWATAIPGWVALVGFAATVAALAFAVPAILWGRRPTRLIAAVLTIIAVLLQCLMI